MLTHLIKSTTFFQGLLSSQFHTLKQGFVNTLVFLSTCHLFGLTNPNQVAEFKFCMYGIESTVLVLLQGTLGSLLCLVGNEFSIF